jgi:hypothetical protein
MRICGREPVHWVTILETIGWIVSLPMSDDRPGRKVIEPSAHILVLQETIIFARALKEKPS